jgi:hypothetical protein
VHLIIARARKYRFTENLYGFTGLLEHA